MVWSWRVPSTAEADALFSEAFATIEQALCYDEVSDTKTSLEMYERGLELINKAEKCKNAKKSELYEQMLKSKAMVEQRIATIKANPDPTISDVDEKLQMEKENLRNELATAGAEDAELEFFVADGVQLFTIDGDETTAPTPPTSLQILRLSKDVSEQSNAKETEAAYPIAFIQVGPWVYPLLSTRTPVLKNELGYMFPNPVPEKPGLLVAIVFCSDITTQELIEFEKTLQKYVDLRSHETKETLSSDEKKRLSSKISDFLISAGEKVAWGVETTSVKIASKVEERGAKYRAANPDAEPKEVNISPAVRTGVIYMHKGSKQVARVTRYLLNKIGDMGVAIGQSLARSATNTFGEGSRTGGLVSGSIAVVGGGIVGVSSVWMALEDGSKRLFKSIANETVQNVKFKYGDEASATAHHALYAAGHASLATVQLWDLGPRSVAGRVARRAGVQMITELHHTGSMSEKAAPLPEKKPL